jgi:hypothetical protein
MDKATTLRLFDRVCLACLRLRQSERHSDAKRVLDKWQAWIARFF